VSKSVSQKLTQLTEQMERCYRVCLDPVDSKVMLIVALDIPS
jgi:hypothetical protein